MTDIPGTSKTSFEIEKEKEKINSQPVSLSLVNVHEIKRVKKEGPQLTTNDWSFLKNWLILGSIPSLISIVLAVIFNWEFLLMTPAGPIIALFCWYLWKYLKRYEKEAGVLK